MRKASYDYFDVTAAVMHVHQPAILWLHTFYQNVRFRGHKGVHRIYILSASLPIVPYNSTDEQ